MAARTGMRIHPQELDGIDIEEIEGQIEHIVYTNEENGYTVVRVFDLLWKQLHTSI